MQTPTRMIVGSMALVMLGFLPTSANNIRVANVAAGNQNVGQQQTHVAFDLSWENSWRNDVNWDAAWVGFTSRIHRIGHVTGSPGLMARVMPPGQDCVR